MRRVRIPHSDGHCFSSGVRTRLPVADVQLSSVGRLKGGSGSTGWCGAWVSGRGSGSSGWYGVGCSPMWVSCRQADISLDLAILPAI